MDILNRVERKNDDDAFFHMDEIVKHVEIIKISDRPKYDTAFERSWLGHHRFWKSPLFDIHRWN